MSDRAGEIRIRPMCAADVDEVLEIAARLTVAPHWPRSAYLRALDRELTPRRIALVATDPAGERVSGFVVAVLSPPEAELESIGVAADFQRGGVGRRLMDALASELGRAGIERLYLEVRRSNAAAAGFYRALGFVEAGVRAGYYTDPKEDAILMELRIG